MDKWEPPPRRDLHVPELEIRYDTGGYGAERELTPNTPTWVDVLEVYPPGVGEGGVGKERVVYKKGLGHDELVARFERGPDKTGELRQDAPVTSEPKPQPKLRIIFARGVYKPDVPPAHPGYIPMGPLTQTRPSDIPRRRFNDVHAAIHPHTASFLTEQIGVSPAFWAVLLWKTWVLKTGNCILHKKPAASEDGSSVEAIEGWYRYSSGLRGFPSHVWFSYTAETTTYILNNARQNGVQDAILQCVKRGMGGSLLRPLAVDGFVAELVSDAWGQEVLRPRMLLVEYERMDGMKESMDTSKSLRELHVASYNILIVKEDMVDHIERLQYLLDLHQTILKTFPPSTRIGSSSVKPATTVPVADTLSFLLSEVSIRKRWVQSYADRIGIQTNLYYSLAAQRDNRTNLQIAKFTSRIATETQKDSSSMITMATMTMLFLPGTFVSAIFSMVFFDASSPTGGLSVSPSAWLFPVITVPLTIIVFITWNAWRIKRNETHVREMRQADVDGAAGLADNGVDTGYSGLPLPLGHSYTPPQPGGWTEKPLFSQPVYQSLPLYHPPPTSTGSSSSSRTGTWAGPPRPQQGGREIQEHPDSVPADLTKGGPEPTPSTSLHPGLESEIDPAQHEPPAPDDRSGNPDPSRAATEIPPEWFQSQYEKAQAMLDKMQASAIDGTNLANLSWPSFRPPSDFDWDEVLRQEAGIVGESRASVASEGPQPTAAPLTQNIPDHQPRRRGREAYSSTRPASCSRSRSRRSSTRSRGRSRSIPHPHLGENPRRNRRSRSGSVNSIDSTSSLQPFNAATSTMGLPLRVIQAPVTLKDMDSESFFNPLPSNPRLAAITQAQTSLWRPRSYTRSPTPRRSRSRPRPRAESPSDLARMSHCEPIGSHPLTQQQLSVNHTGYTVETLGNGDSTRRRREHGRSTDLGEPGSYWRRLRTFRPRRSPRRAVSPYPERQLENPVVQPVLTLAELEQQENSGRHTCNPTRCRSTTRRCFREQPMQAGYTLEELYREENPLGRNTNADFNTLEEGRRRRRGDHSTSFHPLPQAAYTLDELYEEQCQPTSSRRFDVANPSATLEEFELEEKLRNRNPSPAAISNGAVSGTRAVGSLYGQHPGGLGEEIGRRKKKVKR